MKLADILLPEAVFVLNSVSSKKRLLFEIAERAETVFGIDGDSAAQALLEREALGQTGVGRGVALPHARMPGIEGVRALFLRLSKPVAFDAVDRQPVDLVMALFAPEQCGETHLKALALVSRTLRDPGLLTRLRANEDPTALHGLLIESEATRAA